jgi:hypothetical protein
MDVVIIGMDPHKRSATIEVMAADERVLGGGRYGTDAAGYAAMLAEVRRWPQRTWVIEGCQGIGRHIAVRLVAAGERVVDVPPELSARTRVFTAGQGRKTDVTDAHSVALAATRMTGLRQVTANEQLDVLRILADRRRSLGEDHTRMISQLHRLLLDLIPGGAKKALSAAQARALLARVRPGSRRAGTSPGRRRADQRPGTDLPAQESRGQGTDRSAEGHRHDADQPGRDRPVRCCAAPGRGRRHQPVPQPGTFRLVERDRADRRLLRRSCPAPSVPGGEPADQPRPAHHGGGPAPPCHQGPRLLRP